MLSQHIYNFFSVHLQGSLDGIVKMTVYVWMEYKHVE